MSQYVWGMQTKKERIHERIWKKDRKCMSEVDKQKRREYMKEYINKYRENQCQNMSEEDKKRKNVKKIDIEICLKKANKKKEIISKKSISKYVTRRQTKT